MPNLLNQQQLAQAKALRICRPYNLPTDDNRSFWFDRVAYWVDAMNVTTAEQVSAFYDVAGVPH